MIRIRGRSKNNLVLVVILHLHFFSSFVIISIFKFNKFPFYFHSSVSTCKVTFSILFNFIMPRIYHSKE